MIPKVEIIQHVNNVVRSIAVLLAQFIENPNLHQGLVMEALLVSNDFYRNVLISFVIQGSYHLPKASFANHFKDLKTIADVIVNNLKQQTREQKHNKHLSSSCHKYEARNWLCIAITI